MAVNEAFVAKLEILYKKKKELAAIEKARSDEYSESGQLVAAKQAEVTLAEKDVQSAAKAVMM